MAGPRQIVDPARPTPLPYGLLSVAEPRFDVADPHWQNGVTWEPLCPSGAVTWDECVTVTGGGSPPQPAAKEATWPRDVRGAVPFTVFVGYDCGPVGSWETIEQTGRDALAVVEGWQVEHAFWTGMGIGDVGVVYPHLAADTAAADTAGIVLQTAADIVTGTGSFDIVEGLGVLEQQLADCLQGATGIIHVPAVLGPALSAWGLASKDGPRLRTLGGNLVALGAGYPGTGPDGTAPAGGTAWMYGTGPVFAYRSAVRAKRPRESLDRTANTVSMVAERTYVVGWDCCHVAVQVSTGGVAAGTPLAAT